jgi:hypothetical protein
LLSEKTQHRRLFTHVNVRRAFLGRLALSVTLVWCFFFT